MTRADAEALRVKWKQHPDLPACAHSNQELEASEGGYLTGNYCCTACGGLVAANTRDPFQVV